MTCYFVVLFVGTIITLVHVCCPFLYMQLCVLTAKTRKPASGNASCNFTNLSGELIARFTHLWNQTNWGICVSLPVPAEQGLRFFATSTNLSTNLYEAQLWKLPYTFIIVPWSLKGKLPLEWRAHCLLIEGKYPWLPHKVEFTNVYFSNYNSIIGFQNIHK